MYLFKCENNAKQINFIDKVTISLIGYFFVKPLSRIFFALNDHFSDLKSNQYLFDYFSKYLFTAANVELMISPDDLKKIK